MTMGGPWDPMAQMRGTIAQMQQQLHQMAGQLNAQAQGVREMTGKRLGEVDKKLSDLAKIAQALTLQKAGASEGIKRVEDIPGRRIPFTVRISIPIAANSTSMRENSFPISQDGPFVAVKRWATFISFYEFQVTVNNVLSSYSGRSYGRQRPIHSVADLFDAPVNSIVTTANPFPSGAWPSTPGIPSAVSSFRSMEFDGEIEVITTGSGWPRQNVAIPTAGWAEQLNGQVELGCLDFFERGEVITARVTPYHANNPGFGNIDGTASTGDAGYPFLAGQFDPHEGIATNAAFTTTGAGNFTGINTDIVERAPNGVFVVCWEGYRILQPPGV